MDGPKLFLSTKYVINDQTKHIAFKYLHLKLNKLRIQKFQSAWNFSKNEQIKRAARLLDRLEYPRTQSWTRCHEVPNIDLDGLNGPKEWRGFCVMFKKSPPLHSAQFYSMRFKILSK